MKRVEIDSGSGFCFGVVNAINKAEESLEKGLKLSSLGDIVHNGREVDRLEKRGLSTINHQQLFSMKNSCVLLRAHGEPPATYEYARRNNIELIDATCPVVLRLQKRINQKYHDLKGSNSQIAIYGKHGHAEVIGLVGQTDNTALVIESIEEIEKLDFTKGICLFAQTTKSIDGFNALVSEIKSRIDSSVKFEYYDTICRQVSNRIPNIRDFAKRFDLILFVSGKKSSNGKVLFMECKAVNPNSKMVSDESELDPNWIAEAQSIGICGATSTPRWLMEQVENSVNSIIENLA
ncbi:MAG: 4-hydroxy-3-methylbut-2-enyl diphosphate reductase [Bacteroidales bacterium]